MSMKTVPLPLIFNAPSNVFLANCGSISQQPLVRETRRAYTCQHGLLIIRLRRCRARRIHATLCWRYGAWGDSQDDRLMSGIFSIQSGLRRD